MVDAQPPRRLRFVDAAKTLLAVDWPDGHVSTFPLWFLRGWCPCAVCQGHGGAQSFQPHAAKQVVGIQPVGNYAVSFTWDDGHATGIYPFEWLRRWCPCDACGGPREGTPLEGVS
jgi:DUF971 family protein